MKRKISEINLTKEGKISIPNFFHFIWIGDTNLVNIDYIEIWKETNNDKEIFFWCDENTYLCDFFHNSIHNYVLSEHFDNVDFKERDIKNEAFKYIYPRLKAGAAFDKLMLDFLQEMLIPYPPIPIKTLNPWFESSGICVRNIMDLFSHDYEDFFKYYCYELLLRGNLASASDIVRLIIIYQYGGSYIDVDTLPYFDGIFERVNEYLNKNGIVEEDYILLSKTKAILEKINYTNNLANNVDYKNELHRIDPYLNELFEADLRDFSLRKISALGEIHVHKNFILIGSLKRLRGIYFNNVICSHERSKVIRIILRTMRKRYEYLEKNNCIFDFCQDNIQMHYLSRLLSWRSELITKRFFVTPALTGPGLIIEVLLGLVYAIFELEPSITPSFIAEYMQDEKMGIAFYQHNIDTPEGGRSAWRK